ncbi:hypothetical protein [Streptococcus uberis]
MRPKKYPYTNSQWEEIKSNIYCGEDSAKPYATLTHYVNKLTGEIRY